MGKKIRILALILTVVMLIGVIPVSVFAENPYYQRPDESVYTDKGLNLDINSYDGTYNFGQSQTEIYRGISSEEKNDPNGFYYIEMATQGQIKIPTNNGSFSKMDGHKASYSFSFRKKPGAPLITASYIALESNKKMTYTTNEDGTETGTIASGAEEWGSLYFFDINSDGSVVKDGHIIDTITEDKITTINLVIDFEAGTLSYYNADGEVTVEIPFTAPAASGAKSTLDWQKLIQRYYLWFSTKEVANGALLIYDLSIKEGNVFEKANAATSGSSAETGNSINYITNEGTLPENAPTTYDPAVETVLPTPVRSGYEFSGWYTTETFEEGTKVDRIAIGSEFDITLYAKWSKVYINVSQEGIGATSWINSNGSIGGASFATGGRFTTKHDVIATYTFEPNKTALDGATATDKGDCVELTDKSAMENIPFFYYELPEDAKAITDEDGNVTAYESVTLPNTAPAVYYSISSNTSDFTNNEYSLSFSIKSGEGMNFGFDIVTIKYKADGKDEIYEAVLASVVIGSDGLPHFRIGSRDFGIIRSDIYTEYSFRIHINTSASQGDLGLAYWLYINSVLAKTYTPILSGVETYQIVEVASKFALEDSWDKPLMSIEPVQSWNSSYFLRNDASAFAGYDVDTNGTVYSYYDSWPKTVITGDAIVSTAGMVKLNGYSTTLGEKLGMNFYAKVPTAAKTAVVTGPDGEETFTIADMTAEADGSYKFTSKVSSIETRKDVKINFYNADGKDIPIVTDNAGYKTGYTTSVYKYAEELLADETQSVAVKGAAQALINYAAFAENYFDKSGEFDMNAAFAAVKSELVTGLAPELVTGTIEASGASETLGDTAYLVLDDATKIKIDLKKSPVEFTESENIKVIDGKYVEISGIDANNLDYDYSFTVDGVTVSVSAVGIASLVVNGSGYTDEFVNLMKALYLYSEACNELAGA